MFGSLAERLISKVNPTQYPGEAKKFIVGLFDHEDSFAHAIEKIKSEGVEIYDALSPFPIHGIEPVMGLKDTKLHQAGFLFGLTGTTLAVSLITFITTISYPLNIGGKPHWAIPSYVPVIFELTVLCAAFGMVITYCWRNRLFPGRMPRIFDTRITDDRFAITFSIDDKSQNEIDAIRNTLNICGASEIKTKEFTDKVIFE